MGSHRVQHVGQGPPRVLPGPPLSHLQVEWQMPGMRESSNTSPEHQLIRFDARGLGLSDAKRLRTRTLDAHIRDLEAVVNRSTSRTSPSCGEHSGPVGSRFAARTRRCEPTDALVHTWPTWEVVAKLPAQANQQREAVNNLADVDRDLYIRTYPQSGWLTEGDRRTASWSPQAEHRPDRFFENLAHHAAFDAREDLGSVVCPALVFARPAFVGSHVDVAKGLAARMPNARLSLMEGESVAPFIGDTAAVLDAFLSFLSEGEAVAAAHAASENTMRTILYTDIESHSSMMQRLGDERGREVLREHERVIREALREYSGDEVKTFGDGFLASFHSTQMALRCAVALQRSFDRPEPTHGETIRVRVGINAGEPISEGDDLYGHSVLMAAQLAAAAVGGQILVSMVVRELVQDKGSIAGPASRYRGADAPLKSTKSNGGRQYQDDRTYNTIDQEGHTPVQRPANFGGHAWQARAGGTDGRQREGGTAGAPGPGERPGAEGADGRLRQLHASHSDLPGGSGLCTRA